MLHPAIQLRRTRRLAMGGTFLAAVALAVQLGQHGALADDNLLITIPVAFLGAMLSGWVIRPSASLAMASAIAANLAILGVFQTGSAYTDEMLLFGIPFSVAAAIVVGHCRDWKGSHAIIMAILCTALAIGIGMTEFPVPFSIAHMAVIISLPTIPIPPERRKL